MRRAAAVACVAALLVLPGSSQAGTPAYAPIGPPATLNDVVFAADGSMYGTVDAEGEGHPVKAQGAYGPRATLWRSTDHGRTWNAVYEGPPGVRMAVLDSSPADPSSVYVSVEAPGEPNRYLVERIDARTGSALVLPPARLQGIDAAGTAYLLTPINRDYGVYTIYRCAATAATCETVSTLRNLGYALVDPKSVGLLVSAAPLTRANSLQPGPLLISNDGGSTWTAGAILPGTTPNLAFAGTSARTLYAVGRDGADLVSVSHDAGLTWSPSHAVSPEGGVIVGAQPAVALRGGDTTVLISSDEGASFRLVQFPYPAMHVRVDPTDGAHMVIDGGDETQQTWNAGREWSDVADSHFGVVPLTNGLTGGAGRLIYSLDSRYSIWSSHDMGATWTLSQRPPAEGRRQIVVSRDDPRTAYVFAATGTTSGELRTRDGGRTWQPLTMPPFSAVRAIQPGDPGHLFSTTRTTFDSRDAGTTWTPAPPGETCTFSVIADPTSPTGQRLRCDGWSAYDIHRALDARQLPDADGLFGSPDQPGSFALAVESLLGDVQQDWSWSSLLAPTAGFGPAPPDATALAAWPARGGTTFYARSSPTGTTWARRGTGRWWRLQHSGRDLVLYTPLDATHAIVAPTTGDGTAAVIDLAHPDVGQPEIQNDGRTLTCVVPWSPTDAVTSAYAWLRDGSVLRAATRLQRAISRFDHGRDLSCRATARNAWGSTTVASTHAVRVPGARKPLPRPHIQGSARVGARIRCRGIRVDWLRDGRPIPHAHAHSYLVRAADLRHAISCEEPLADGTLVRSRSARVAR